MEKNNESLALPQHLELQSRELSLEYTERGLHSSEIEHYLNQGIYKHVHATCAKHVWISILLREEYEYTTHIGRQITAVLRNLEGWEPLGQRSFGRYGRQRVFIRTEQTVEALAQLQELNERVELVDSRNGNEGRLITERRMG